MQIMQRSVVDYKSTMRHMLLVSLTLGDVVHKQTSVIACVESKYSLTSGIAAGTNDLTSS